MSDLKVDTSKPALVTGATGYVAGVLIKELLEHGVTVHAAVRDPSKTGRLQHLIDLAAKSKGSIKFFRGDLLDEGSYAEGMKGCSVVFHTASPFAVSVADPQKDLVDPAVKGTRNVLNEATKSGTVKRVVVTSSCAAIYTDASDTCKAPNDIFTEEVWNMTASLDYQPYSFSKTMAEHAAWEVAGGQTQWSMATINPSFVMGPGTKYHGTSESFGMIKSLGDGQMASGAPNISFGVVDVRDVAHAHVVAGYNHNVKGRHVLSGHDSGILEMAQCLKAKYFDYPLPPRKFPKMFFWLLAPYLGVGMTRRFVWNNVDVPIRFDNSKSKKELGIKYKSLSDTMNDMFQQLVEEGVVQKK